MEQQKRRYREHGERVYALQGECQYRQMDDKMIKAQGMYLMLYAGEFLGGDYMEIGDWEKYHYKMDNAGDGLKRYDPGALFTDQTEKVLLSEDVDPELMKMIVNKFIETPFSNVNKYIRRNDMIKELEND